MGMKVRFNDNKSVKDVISVTAEDLRFNIPSPHLQLWYQRIEKTAPGNSQEIVEVIENYRFADVVSRRYVTRDKDGRPRNLTRQEAVERLRTIGLVYLARSIVGKGKIRTEKDALMEVVRLSATLKGKDKEKFESLAGEVWTGMVEEIMRRVEDSGSSSFSKPQREINDPWPEEREDNQF